MLFVVGKSIDRMDICLMNNEQLFQLALNIEAPWFVTKTEFRNEEGKKSMHITLEYQSGFFTWPTGHSAVHDRLDRMWRHMNFFEHECYLHCKVPRVYDQNGKVKQVEVPWARAGSGFTLLFEAYSMFLIEQEMPVNKVGKTVAVYPKRLWTVFNYWISTAYSKADHAGIKVLGIDETSAKKGHDYLTIAVDMEQKRVVHVTKGKGSDTITEIAKYLKKKKSKPKKVGQVCIDLSPAFISGVCKEFPKAEIVFDRFHVKALLNKAMDELRKKEVKKHDMLKGQKYLYLKAEKNLKAYQVMLRDISLEALPTLGEAYRLKILFDDFWSIDEPQNAQGFLAYWCDLAVEAGIESFAKFAKTVADHWNGITNYTKYHISNGILEGINSKVQLAKARARGYRNTDNFINMIYFIAGKLKFNYPHYST